MRTNRSPVTAGTLRSINQVRTTLVYCAFALTTALGACRETAATPEGKVAQQGAAAPGPETVLASVGSEKVTMADVQARSGDELGQLEGQYQLAKSRIVQAALDTILRERTLSAETKRTGKSVEDLITAEGGPAGLTPSD